MSALQSYHPEKEIKVETSFQAWKDNDDPGASIVALW